MIKVEITSEAKCKHCVFLKGYTHLKKDGTASRRKRYVCANPESPEHQKFRRAIDLVCEQWKLITE